MSLSSDNLQAFLDHTTERYNRPEFILSDPISVPHKYKMPQDIELAAFFTAIFAWGQRKTIINKANELFALMDNSPYDFIKNHTETDRKNFIHFKHRTFQLDDTLYFLEFLQHHFQTHTTLETAFSQFISPTDDTVEKGIAGFHTYFFSLPNSLPRTRKHIATPARYSTCKRLNMFLRWMVRRDDKGVDFGLWKTILPAQLVIPLDVHVERQARKLGLLKRTQIDWLAAVELTHHLRQFSINDPVQYDFALFGMGVSPDF